MNRAYADLRDLDGGRRALIPPGETRATTDPEIAERLLTDLMNTLEERRRNRVLLGVDPDADLAEFAIHHLQIKARSGQFEERWLAISETYLARAVAFFTRYQYATERNPEPKPQPRNLAAISVPDVRAFVEWLAKQPNRRGKLLGRQSCRHHLSVLSGLFRRAISEGKLPLGQNPVSALMEKPRAPKSRTTWLEVDELALLLESARTLAALPTPSGRRPPLPCAYELLATFLLTGAREGEIRRLQVSDLDFTSMIIDIPGTKTERSDRIMPMHPQLSEILRPYVERLGRRTGPLFTSGTGGPLGDWRKTLDTIAERAGYPAGQVRTRVFRTSYITHRLASIDHGAPIDPYQVAREVGHSSLTMIMKVYGRVQRRRVRLEEMAFRPEAIGPHLADRLAALYLPQAAQEDARLREDAELMERFLVATERLSTHDVCVATGISKPTVNRIRARGQTTLQGRTRQRISEFLTRVSESGRVAPAQRRP